MVTAHTHCVSSLPFIQVPSWITEDTSSTYGRVSKFLKFNLLPCVMNGPVDRTVHPLLSSSDGSHEMSREELRRHSQYVAA